MQVADESNTSDEILLRNAVKQDEILASFLEAEKGNILLEKCS